MPLPSRISTWLTGAAVFPFMFGYVRIGFAVCAVSIVAALMGIAADMKAHPERYKSVSAKKSRA